MGYLLIVLRLLYMVTGMRIDNNKGELRLPFFKLNIMNKKTIEEELVMYKEANRKKKRQLEALQESVKSLRETLKNLKVKLKEKTEEDSNYKWLERRSKEQDIIINQQQIVIKSLITEFELPDKFIIYEKGKIPIDRLNE